MTTEEAAIERLTAGHPDTQSALIVDENLERLCELFPEAFTEGRIDFDVLRQLLGDNVDDGEERYGLNWRGKRAARRLALTPSTGTLRPAPEESVDWDVTQHLVIEGDNLEVLKLLQKSYAGKVKLIYIDPPYNLGKDRIYPDDFNDSITNYLMLTGQVDSDGRTVVSNTEASGRFHTTWLNMMYPRLLLAREMLRRDGLIFVSIDTKEVSHLRLLMDEIFGYENLIGLLPTIMNLKGNNDSFGFSDTHEFTLVYARSIEDCVIYQFPVDEDALEEWDEDEYGLFKRADTLRRTGQDASRERRPNGWFPVYITETDHVYTTDDDRPRNQGDEEIWPKNDAGEELSWTWSKRKINEDNHNLIVVRSNGRPVIYKKQRPGLGGVPSSKPKSTLYKPEYSSGNGTAEVATLLGKGVFDSPPKPRALIRDFVILGAQGDDIVLDFFAGTGTTGHAVMAQNARDGANRRFIVVQLPEPLSVDRIEERIAAEFCDSIGRPQNIAELTKERLRRSAAKIREEQPEYDGDLGFRVFKLDSSNIREWDPRPEDLEATLDAAVENLKADRTEQDILHELLLKRGIELTVPIETREVAGKPVHSIGAGTLFACLDARIERTEAEPLALGIVAWRDELDPAGDVRVVFRDSAFVDDVAKTNLAEILKQHGLADVKSI